MYYTTSGAYRRSKMIIDYTNIGLTVVIGVLFILICFLRSKSGLLFPAIFATGALMNGLTATKRAMDSRYLQAGILAVVTIGLLIMSVLSYFVVC